LAAQKTAWSVKVPERHGALILTGCLTGTSPQDTIGIQLKPISAAKYWLPGGDSKFTHRG